MFDFQKKIEKLRQFESLCFTVCVTLLTEEQAANNTAERVLCQLFADKSFWLMEESEKPPYILRLCTCECMQYKRQNQQNQVKTS
ncbi:hypothetical protein BK133_22380 [Paenibacillus sp. FSL H8-0548]|uniref:hypothetical protein n=1 Tax=Paenibacillus sp. FSL H8-0548 TaxID=1920422 RepID=UPI00096CA6E8|nr:hypothetical protein [Paenibacillus sp. FSL H8-0548]OMF24843.1 hypothetical protein BK133_22380 [Paenibacillus sp. FSL H8-0548]